MRRPSIERLREAFGYDPNTGILFWKISPCSTVAESDIAGRITKEGYRFVMIDGCGILAHHICWAIHYGAWAHGELDHRDCSGLNNRISNLRPATSSQNKCNTRVRSDSRTGIKGVVPWPDGRFRAQIKYLGKYKHLGLFKTAQEAKEVRDLAALLLHGEFARCY